MHATTIYTVGHSNHRADRFLGLLKGTGIELLVDVRSRPYSRWALYANRRELPSLLAEAGMEYLFLGEQLGGRPRGGSHDSGAGMPDRELMQGRPEFKQGLARLLAEAGRRRTCIMCAEEDPLRCHRHFLIADALRRSSVQVLHIRGTGEVQDDEDIRPDGTGSEQLRLPW